MIDQRRPVGGDPVDVALAALVNGGVSQVVDVGGGSGTRAVPLALAGCRVTVVDTSVDALAILHRRVAGRRCGGPGRRCPGRRRPARHRGAGRHGRPGALPPPARRGRRSGRGGRRLAAAVRPGGHVSVLAAGRLGAVLGQTLVGRFADARAMLTDPDGRFGSTDPLRRRYDVGGIGRTADRRRSPGRVRDGGRGAAGLVSGAARQATPGGDGELALLEAAAAWPPWADGDRGGPAHGGPPPGGARGPEGASTGPEGASTGPQGGEVAHRTDTGGL